MSEFKLPNAVSLFSQEKTTITSLWTVYVAATFAAAGYGFSADRLNVFTASAVTLGFSAFAFGNWKLLKQSLTINKDLQKTIRAAVACDQDKQFESSLKVLIDNANPIWVSLMIHLFIDSCVIVAIWTRVKVVADKIFGI